MKTLIFLALVLICLNGRFYSQKTIITDDPSYITGEATAVLEAKSISKGFLPPRMNTGQRNAIASPAIGLTIFNTTTNCLETWDGGMWFGSCTLLSAQYEAGSVFCNGPTKIVPVLNPTTGKTWMDRNLGAKRAATVSTDTDAFGDLYQWGRRSDGHHCVYSPTTSTLSNSDKPLHGNFIIAPNSPYDWRSPQNNNLWQGVNGTNNPCPDNYRVPTEAELDAERLSWSSNNAAGAFSSPLKLPVAGFRNAINGSSGDVGSRGYYWSNTVSSSNSRVLLFSSNDASMGGSYRAHGRSVRCIKD